jgi:hypothetical protein
MVKSRAQGPGRPEAADRDAESPPKPAKQLKPHPLVFRILCVIFAIWMALLLVMYFWTVYPMRHPGK